MEQVIQEGTLLADKYRVDRVLGQGGMGVVLAATHLQLEQQVAIKVLSPGVAPNPDTLGRFLREARASSRLKSEHVARTLDVGSLQDGSPYMVMEFLQGHDLQRELQLRGALPVEEAIAYLLQACEGLAEAHAKSIVHRDLKPANLFLTTRIDGTPCLKILDFGISKLSEEGFDHGMTQTSAMLGTPYYMSPEQLRSSRAVDARSDVWSLGIILHELLTGRPPFTASALPELCANILTEPPESLREHHPDLPDGLDLLLEKCLQKDREERYQDIAELGRALAIFHPQGDAFAARIERTLHREISTPSLVLPRVSLTDITLAAEPPPPRTSRITPPALTGAASPGPASAALPRPLAALAGVFLLAVVAVVTLGSRETSAVPPGGSPSSTSSALPSPGSGAALVISAMPSVAAPDLPALAVPPTAVATASVRAPLPRGSSRSAPRAAPSPTSLDFGTRK